MARNEFRKQHNRAPTLVLMQGALTCFSPLSCSRRGARSAGGHSGRIIVHLLRFAPACREAHGTARSGAYTKLLNVSAPTVLLRLKASRPMNPVLEKVASEPVPTLTPLIARR
jgi:hypothetical protein